MEHLDKIDLLRERMEISYERANRVLEETGGDVVQALIKLEKELGKDRSKSEEKNVFRVKSEELVNRVKQLIKEGNINKIAVKNRDKTLVEIPVNAGVVSLVLFPYLTVLAGMAAMYKEYTLEIEREEESEE